MMGAAKERSEAVSETEIYRQRWQRVLKAYLALRELRTITKGRAQTPVMSRLVLAMEDLRPEDLQVMQ